MILPWAGAVMRANRIIPSSLPFPRFPGPWYFVRFPKRGRQMSGDLMGGFAGG